MNAKMIIKTEEGETNLLFNDIKDKSNFSGSFNDEHYDVLINDDICIKRSTPSQKTIVKICKKADSSIEIINENGSILLNIKVVEIIENNGMISLVYKIDDMKNELRIEFY